jgi:hypothetical protein
MTTSKDYWWTRKSFETVLTVAVFVWFGALVVNVLRTAHTPVRGTLIVSVLTSVTVGTIMYFNQLRKGKAPANSQAKMPNWLPPMQIWYMAGLLLLLIYLQVVVSANAAGASWTSAWLSFTAPFSDLVSRVVPSLDANSESLATHGYEDRVPIVRHAQWVSWMWLFLVNMYLVYWFILRWEFTKSHVKTLAVSKIIIAILFVSLIFVLSTLFAKGAHVLYEDRSHSMFNLIHYSDSSLILNSVFSL